MDATLNPPGATPPAPLDLAAPADPAAPAPPPAAPSAGNGVQYRPVVSELRLSAFGVHRGAVFGIGPVTLFAGPSGSGKSQVLAAYEALAALGAGTTLEEAFPDPRGRIPDRALPDGQGRRGFRIGCTVDGPAGPVRLDLAVQAEPTLRIVGERLSADGQILLATALRDPGRQSVQASWLTGGAVGVTRAPSPMTGSAPRCSRCAWPAPRPGSGRSWRPPSRWWWRCARCFPATRAPTGCAHPSRRARAGCWATAPTWPTSCAGPVTSAAPATRCWPRRRGPAARARCRGWTYGLPHRAR